MSPEFANLVLIARKLKFRSARACYTANEFSFSYQCYACVERGEHPSLEVAVAIIKALKLNEEQALKAWVRDQFPPKYKHIFIDSEERSENTKKFKSKVQQMNRMQVKLIERDPLYLDLLVFVSCYSRFNPVSAEEISETFGIDLEQAKTKLESLYDYGIVDRKGNCYTMSNWVIIPEREEFRRVRQKNFLHSLRNHKRAGFNDLTIQYSITRLVNKPQREELKARMKALREWIISLEDDPGLDLFSVILAGNKRRLGNAGTLDQEQD